MDDQVASVDQHPVTMRQAFDPRTAKARVLQRPKQVIGQCADVPVRTAGGHDHAIGHAGLVGQIDGDDVLGLVVVEFGENDPDQVIDGNAVLLGICGRFDSILRGLRDGGAQLENSWYRLGKAPTRTTFSKLRR